MHSDEKIEPKPVLPSELKETILCPVTGVIFHTPVMLLPSGITVEEDTAKTILKTQEKLCPVTRMRVEKYVKNFAMVGTVDALLNKYAIDADDRYQPAEKTVTVNTTVNVSSSSSATVNASSSSNASTAVNTSRAASTALTERPLLNRAPTPNTEYETVPLPSSAILISPYFLRNDQTMKVNCMGPNSVRFWQLWNPYPPIIGIDFFNFTAQGEMAAQARIKRYSIWNPNILTDRDSKFRQVLDANVTLLFPCIAMTLPNVIEALNNRAGREAQLSIRTGQAQLPIRKVYIGYNPDTDFGRHYEPFLANEWQPPRRMRINRNNENLIQTIGQQLERLLTRQIIDWADELRNANPALNQDSYLIGRLRPEPQQQEAPSNCLLM